jgi:hypothetical protein
VGLLWLSRLLPETTRGGEVMSAIEFDTDESARELLGGDQCRARTAQKGSSTVPPGRQKASMSGRRICTGFCVG